MIAHWIERISYADLPTPPTATTTTTAPNSTSTAANEDPFETDYPKVVNLLLAG